MSDKSFDEIMEARAARKAAAAKEKEEQKQRELLILDEHEQRLGDGHVRAVWTTAGLVIIRCPTPGEMARFREALLGTKAKASENASSRARAWVDLAKQCAIYPSKEGYAALVEQYPGVPDAVAKKAVEFAGEAEEEEAGKS